MRDAYGGLYMFRILLIFLAVFIVFIAVAINYARAFRIKNDMINIIEQNEGIRENNYDASHIKTTIDRTMEEKNYKLNADSTISNWCTENGYSITNDDYGYCIEKIENPNNDNQEYYKVVSFIIIKVPVIENLKFTIPVKGETRMIERINS